MEHTKNKEANNGQYFKRSQYLFSIAENNNRVQLGLPLPI